MKDVGLDLSRPAVRQGLQFITEFPWLMCAFPYLPFERISFEARSLDVPANLEELVAILEMPTRGLSLYQASDGRITGATAIYTDGRSEIRAVTVDGPHPLDDRNLTTRLSHRNWEKWRCIGIAITFVNRGERDDNTWLCRVFRPGRTRIKHPALAQLINPATGFRT